MPNAYLKNKSYLKGGALSTNIKMVIFIPSTSYTFNVLPGEVVDKKYK